MLAWLVLTTGALAEEPCSVEADLAIERAYAHWEAGEDQRLQAAANAAVGACPSSVHAQLLQFQIAAWQQGDTDRAEGWLDRALTLDPCNTWALGWKVQLHSMRDDHEAAREVAVHSVACNPREGSWGTLGMAQKRLGSTLFRPVVNPDAWVQSGEAEWLAHLEQAKAAGFEQEARFAHTLAEDQVSDYLSWRDQNLDRMKDYLVTMVAPAAE